VVDVVRVMTALAEQGVTVLFKADAERMRDEVRPWTFVASGGPFHEDPKASAAVDVDVG